MLSAVPSPTESRPGAARTEMDSLFGVVRREYGKTISLEDRLLEGAGGGVVLDDQRQCPGGMYPCHMEASSS